VWWEKWWIEDLYSNACCLFWKGGGLNRVKYICGLSYFYPCRTHRRFTYLHIVRILTPLATGLLSDGARSFVAADIKRWFRQKVCFITAVQSNTKLFDLQFTEFIVVICRKDKSDFLSVETPCNIISCLHVILTAKLLLYCRLVLNAVLNSEGEIVSFIFASMMSDMGVYLEPATLMP
jgi:hypothetical protein